MAHAVETAPDLQGALAAARDYLASPWLDPTLRHRLAPLVARAADGDEEAVRDLDLRFDGALRFGTGGLRALMGPGTARMNLPNVHRAALALARVARRRAPGRPQGRPRALVGHDSRWNSRRYALEAARVLAAEGFEVYHALDLTPTGFVSFALRALGASCGVNITASHNPREYNGFKAYDDRGGQVVAPWDAEIEAEMESMPLVPEPPGDRLDAALKPIPPELREAFLELGLSYRARPEPFEPVRLHYTPLHGAGGGYVPELFLRGGLPLSVSEAQGRPDGAFPTCPKPNPELGRVFRAPLAEAVELGAEAILANDPDADRIALMAPPEGARTPEDWRLVSGNQLGALVLDYLARLKGLRGAVLTTVVTSDLVAETARHHGLPVLRTLTGFKLIAALMDDLPRRGLAFAFAAEESFGLLLSDRQRDKDGVLPTLLVAEMLGHHKALGRGPWEALAELEGRVGRFRSRLVGLEDTSHGHGRRFMEAMARCRRCMPGTLDGVPVTAWEDFAEGLRHEGSRTAPLLDQPDRPDLARPLGRSDVLKLFLEDGGWLAVRPSGTEPKLKLYLQSRRDEAQLDRLEAEARRLLEL